MPFGNRKKYFTESFQFSIVTILKISPSGNLIFNYLVIFPSLKLRILMGKFLSISLKLNFTPNTLGSYVVTKSLSGYGVDSHFPNKYYKKKKKTISVHRSKLKPKKGEHKKRNTCIDLNFF